MKTNLKKKVLSIVMASTIAITSILSASTVNTAQAKADKIQYNNTVFTNKLYKKTALNLLIRKQKIRKQSRKFINYWQI